MDSGDSKKRRYHETPLTNTKRLCQQETPEHLEASTNTDDDVPSVIEILSVPLDFIFREAPQLSESQRRRKPLLSRAEAQCFLNATILASELDSLTAAATQALEQKVKYREFADKIAQRNHPSLRCLLPILHNLSYQIPDDALSRIQIELERVTQELKMTCESLRQFSEQNWALSESLMDLQGISVIVAKEKRRLSDVQEELCNRIDGILGNKEFDTTHMLKMKDYCDQVLQSEPPMSPPSQHSQIQVESISAEKENAPSQDISAQCEEAVDARSRSAGTSLDYVFRSSNSQSESQSQQSPCRTQHAAEVLSTLRGQSPSAPDGCP